MNEEVVDFIIGRVGDRYLLGPISDDALLWVEAHIPLDALHYGGGVVIDQDRIDGLIDSILSDGLAISGD